MRELNETLTIHELKTWPGYFEAVALGVKPFEIRKNDRKFQRGDILLLKEWEPKYHRYTGRTCRVTVAGIWNDLPPGFGLEPGYCVMAVTNPELLESTPEETAVAQ